MKITGSHTFKAPRNLLWLLLHDLPVIQQSIPGCDHFHLHADGKYHIALTLSDGPFSGRYEGHVTRLEEKPQESIQLAISGNGPELAFFGAGTLRLEENHEETILVYEGDVEISGQIPLQSPRLTRTTANFLIRNFMEGLDRQLQQLAGVSGDSEFTSEETAIAGRETSTIGMQDFLAEIRRDRLVALVVLLLILLASLSVLGAVFLGMLTMRWLIKSLNGRSLLSQTEQHRLTPPSIEGQD